MIAAACIAAHIPPQAFGVDDVDVAVIGEEIVAELQEQARKGKEQEMLERARRR